MSKFISPERSLRTFLNLTRSLPSRFERTRVWSPQSIMIWLMLLTLPDRKTSYRSAIRGMTRFAMRSFGWIHRPTLASICQARRKMTVTMCREMLKTVVAQCQAIMGRTPHRYGNRRFIAFDGTRLVARRSADTARKLHRYSKPDGSKVHNPQGLMVAAVDVFRRLPLDWIMVGKKAGERTALMRLLETLELIPGDVAIMDRGLPSRELFRVLLERGVDVVARMSTSDARSWNELEGFLSSGKLSAIIPIQLGNRAEPITVRARVVERARQRGRPRTGTAKERMVILTTLTEESGFSRVELIKIYGARWGIESLFCELKSFMSVEPFHTKMVDGIEQEVAASFIWMALGSTLQADAESGREDWRVYRTDCLRAASDLISDLLRGLSITERYAECVDALRQYGYKDRPDRHAPRICQMPFGRSVKRGTR